MGEFSVSILCKNKDNDEVWDFFGVCGSCDQTEFWLFREDLCRTRSLWQVSWCVGGISMQ